MIAKKNRYIILHLVVMVYLIAAFTWWAILLYNKNEENYILQQRLVNTSEFVDNEITEKYQKQKRMILSEGLFFGISILIGLVLVNRSFRKEVQLNQALNDFLLSVTHELKTPIASIKLVNKTLATKDLTADKKQRLLRTGQEESQRLESLVNNILTAAQIENSYVFNFENTRIDSFVKEKVDRYAKLFPERTFVYQPKNNIVASVDKEAFAKAIDNLISNAIKYSPKVSPITIAVNEKSSSISIDISDNGQGIIPTERQNIWKKFYRVGSEETRETKGTGLGLWIVQQVVSAHKGTIQYSSNEPKGSIFRITIPAA